MFQHGAVNGVMGSHHQLQMGTLSNLLIDGGLFQAMSALSAVSSVHCIRENFVLAGIKVLMLTHVQADHVGCIP